MSYTAFLSPLRHKQVLGGVTTNSQVANEDELADRESNFVNDAIWTETVCRSRDLSIIPPYDALTDPASKGYFITPVAQSLIAVTINGEPRRVPTRSLNKLSTRHRAPLSPGLDELRMRENSFINDAILTEKQRTKYKDTLLVPYEALDDVHCRKFFKKETVKEVLRRTKPGAVIPVRQSRSLSRSPTRMPSQGDKTSRSSGENGKNLVRGSHSISEILIDCPLASIPQNMNKLSTRGRCLMTPPTSFLKKREEMFVNDAIVTERSRTKYKDIIPPYTAVGDQHCRHYFLRTDVQRLLSKTSPQESLLLRRKKTNTT